MHCSTCSKIVKPVVAIDIDGTLGDYHGHFLRFAAEYLGEDLDVLFTASLNMYGGDESFGDYVCRHFHIDRSVYRDIKLSYRQGGMKRSMPIFPSAQSICNMVTREGAELWITTTRPYLSLDNVVPDTVAWMDRHTIGFDYILFDADKYAVLADRVDSERVVAVLDDLGEMYDAAEEQFGAGVPILIGGKFNRKVQRFTKRSLREAEQHVQPRIRWWKEQHGGQS